MVKAMTSFLDHYFSISASGSTVFSEFRAGFTTFIAMVYILFVNPMILGDAIVLESSNGFGQLLTATALAAAFGSFLMGALARYPFALAPGMGLNAYFAYTVVLGQGVPWQTAMGLIFLSGLVIVLLTVVGIRSFIMRVLPTNIKHAISAGIGLFLAFIGAKNCGLIVGHPETLVSLGNFASPQVQLAVFGLFLTLALFYFNFKGAVFWGIVVSSALGILLNLPVFGGKEFVGFQGGVIQAPAWPTELFMSLDIKSALAFNVMGIVFTFVMVDLFDTAGTLLGLSQLSGFTSDVNKLSRMSHAFMADAVATSVGAVVGTSSTTSYLESAAGIKDGGKTGLTAIAVGFFFLISIFLWPLAQAVPAAATAPALLIIGSMMMSSLKNISWDDMSAAFPAFLVLFIMPLTFSIANGISAGIIAYVMMRLFTGRIKEVHWMLILLAILLSLRFSMA